MFELDVRHFASTILHPKYRQLKGCSKEERNQACAYIREEMNKIIKNDRSNDLFPIEPTTKKQKIEISILEEYEDTSGNESDLEEKEDDNLNSDVVNYKLSKPDELNK